jgi:hypothetical protein
MNRKQRRLALADARKRESWEWRDALTREAIERLPDFPAIGAIQEAWINDHYSVQVYRSETEIGIVTQLSIRRRDGWVVTSRRPGITCRSCALFRLYRVGSYCIQTGAPRRATAEACGLWCRRHVKIGCRTCLHWSSAGCRIAFVKPIYGLIRDGKAWCPSWSRRLRVVSRGVERVCR